MTDVRRAVHVTAPIRAPATTPCCSFLIPALPSCHFTGASGATVRMYIEQYTQEPDKLALDAADALAPIIKARLCSLHATQAECASSRPSRPDINKLHQLMFLLLR